MVSSLSTHCGLVMLYADRVVRLHWCRKWLVVWRHQVARKLLENFPTNLPWTNDLVHYNDVITGTIASQITSLTTVYWTVYSDADQRKHQSSASLAFVRGIHRGPMNSPHKWPETRKTFPFDDVIMTHTEHNTKATLYSGASWWGHQMETFSA